MVMNTIEIVHFHTNSLWSFSEVTGLLVLFKKIKFPAKIIRNLRKDLFGTT